ncbi:MAG TPA: hypothetical protein VKI19_00655 [Acidimicrobiales bacterium]|nr:hypothetical protein [Acidimicrobiales bacterium]
MATATVAGAAAPSRRDVATARRTRLLLGAVIFVVYLIPALIEFWHVLPHLATWEPEFGGGDLAKYNWCVQWVPYALGHGHNPFITHVANVPYGVNLMNDTSVLGLGLVMAPITVLFGPYASVNLLLILAYPLSASAGYLLARRYVTWAPGAFVAGLLYGYSPYMVGQGYGHLNLSFVPLPPLILLALDELFVRQTRNPVKVGILLGLMVTAQVMISTEIFATTVLFSAVALAVLAIWFRRDVRRRLPHALRGLIPGAALAVVLLAWPLYETVFGPYHIHGVIAGFRIYDSALLGPLLPTSLMQFGTHHMKVLGDRIGGNNSENGSYLGLPLVALLVVTPFLVRRRPVIIAAVLTAAAFILSLGVRLHIGLARYAATTRHVVLPGAVLDKIPLFNDSFPVRYTLYVALFASVLLAFALQALEARKRRPWLTALVALVCLLPLVPKWPGPVEGKVRSPSYFTTSAVNALAPGEVALIYPIAVPTNSAAMDWQAQADMRFSMPGGYFVVPKPGSGSQFFEPTATEQNLTALSNGQALDRTPSLRTQLIAELRSWGVTAVVAQPVGADPVGFFAWLTGRPPDAELGGMIEWYHVDWAASS